MSFVVAVAEQAHRDIHRNAMWWGKHHSLDQAITWVDTVYEQLEGLRSMPEMHGVATENANFPFELREKLVGTGPHPGYRAIFTIEKNTVHVLAIRRGSQDAIHPTDLQYEKS